HKTIRKEVVLGPRETLSVGDELTLGRLRVRIHGIKVEGKMLDKGSAEAKEIVRVFAKPVRL
ncbi:MAG TPA: HVO_0476 family zinc finger protein, partial [Candidatus Thermoplasmatota archaeon]|nr:HVO_0476 family zinc finger protein [Candidatus Thermoplasmatota archaeon]